MGKYIKATRELKRAWATNLPSSWSYGLPIDDDQSSGGSTGGSAITIETANQGFNPDGSLDGITKFTHTETYIPFSNNTNKKVEFVIEGWTRAIFYDSNKNRIGYTDSTGPVTYLSMSELQSISPNAVYVRVSINKTTTITLTDDNSSGGSTGGSGSGGSGGSGEVKPNTFDFSQENVVEYGSYGDYRTPVISRAGYSKVTITTEVAGYIGIIMFSNETTIMASYDDNY